MTKNEYGLADDILDALQKYVTSTHSDEYKLPLTDDREKLRQVVVKTIVDRWDYAGMFVTRLGEGTAETAQRVGRPCEFRANGSFVDVWLTIHGEKMFVSLNKKDLLMACGLAHGQSISGFETHDEPIV